MKSTDSAITKYIDDINGKLLGKLLEPLTIYYVSWYIDEDGLQLSFPYIEFSRALNDQQTNEYVEGYVAWIETVDITKRL